MAIKEYSRSTKAAILISSTAVTYLLVFVVTLLTVNATRKYPPMPPTTPPTNMPTNEKITDPPTQSPYDSSYKDTTPPTVAQMECPMLTIGGEKNLRQIGNVIEGEFRNYNLTVQPVAISHDGNIVVLGNPWGKDSDSVPYGPATVKVFNLKGNQWSQKGNFVGQNEDKYGQTISLSGDGQRLAIGALWTDVQNIRWAGHVETYDFNEENTWVSVGQKLTGLNTGDLFGVSISLSDDGKQMAIGAIQVNGGDSGSANMYELIGGTWTQLGETLNGEAADDMFGNAVSMSGDGSIVAVGAWYSDENGSDSGSVQVFRYSSNRRTKQETQGKRNVQSLQDKGEWLQVGQKLLGGASNDGFGWSLSINKEGNTLAVGTNGGNYAQIFHLNNNKWNPMGSKLVGENVFGFSVSLAPSAHRLAVGSYDNDGGYVKIFDFIENDWVLIQYIVSPPSDKYFGTSVSLSACGDQIAIGSVNNTHGHMSVYELV